MPIVLPAKNLKNTFVNSKSKNEHWTAFLNHPSSLTWGTIGRAVIWSVFSVFFLILLEFWKVGSIFRIKWQLTVSFGLMDQSPVSHEKPGVSCYLLGIFYRVTQ